MSESPRTSAVPVTIDTLGRYIETVQREDGLIPWYSAGPADPWDHVESAMGLSITGRHKAAEEAYEWLRRTQLPTGGWWAAYGDGTDEAGEHDDGEPRIETHRSAYIAVGVWHHYQITSDQSFLERLWPIVATALEFVLDNQAQSGEIYWAIRQDGSVYTDALKSASASVYKSLECGAALAEEMGESEQAEQWLRARRLLGEAIRNKPDRFDRTWESKSRYAMDWFYPVLCGVLPKRESHKRLEKHTETFLVPDLGCRCVSDEPWVTVAETCELILALAAVGQRTRALEIFSWLDQWTDENGIFWTGYQFEEREIWPEEKPTWTAGAAILAADAIEQITPAAELFLQTTPESAEQPMNW